MSQRPLPERTEREMHFVNVRVSRELKEKLRALAEKYDRPAADVIRSVLKIGIPMLEGVTAAEEQMVREYVGMFRRLRRIRSLKDI